MPPLWPQGVPRGAQHPKTIAVAERWSGQSDPWQIKPFSDCEVLIGGELVLTGYVDGYVPSYDARGHGVRIAGRSKTEDVIDCTPDLPGGQFSGYTLDRIARAIATPFGVDVVVKADVGAPFPDATIERHETGFQFLERLARLRSILLTDDERGRLVLTTAGADRADDALVQGKNILRADGRLDTAQRFSEYRVKTQVGVQVNPFQGLNQINRPVPPTANKPDTDGGETYAEYIARYHEEADDHEPPQTQATTVTQGIAYDRGVPRYRPHTIIAESGLDAAGAQKRADWQARHNAGRAMQVNVEVRGFHQSTGKLWRPNETTTVTSRWLQIDQPLLIAAVSFEKDGGRGNLTRLTLGPVEAYQPDPGQVRVRKPTGGGGGDWTADIKKIPASSGGAG